MSSIYRTTYVRVPICAYTQTDEQKEQNTEFIPFKMLLYGMNCHVQQMTRGIMAYVTKTAPYNKVGTVKYITNKLHATFINVENNELKYVPEKMMDRYDSCGAYIAKNLKGKQYEIHEAYTQLNPNAPDAYLVALIDTALSIGYAYETAILEAVESGKPKYLNVTKKLVKNITGFTGKLHDMRKIVLGTMAYRTPYIFEPHNIPIIKAVKNALDDMGNILNSDELWKDIGDIFDNE